MSDPAKANVEVVSGMLLRQYNERDVTAVDVIAENHIDHNPTPGQEHGREGVRKLIAGVLESSDVKCEIHDCFGSGDLVATRYTLTSTHRGDLFGMPAAGKTTVTRIIEIDRVQNGEIVESWGEFNPLEMMQQLDLMPEGFPNTA
jgi:predicted ester cyclase